MIKLVSYKEILGDFYDDFCRIFKALWYAVDLDKATERFERKELDTWEKHREKKWQLSFCGFRISTSGNKELWWKRGYIPTVNTHGEVIFNIPMNQGETEKIEHIALSEFLDMKKDSERDSAEAEYYGVKKETAGLAKQVDMRRKDIYGDDPDFILESEAR